MDFHGFYGQRSATRRVRPEIDGAKALGESFPNSLLGGGSGLGKSHFVRALALDYGSRLHYILCGRQITPLRLGRDAQEWEPHDFVFFDEGHMLSEDVQEVLYRLIDAHMAPRVITTDKGKSTLDGEVEVAPVSVIVATDRIGDLRRALVKRLPLAVTLEPYTERDMAYIIRSYAAELEMLLSTQAPGMLARICQGIPRIARHRLESLRRFYAGKGVEKYTRTHVRRYFNVQGIDRHYRTPDEQLYMRKLARFGRKGASIGRLASAMHLDRVHVAGDIELPLVVRGWVEVDKRRILTDAGWEIVNAESRGADHD